MFHRKPGQISPKSHPAQQKLQQTSNTTAPQVKETHPATLIQRAKAERSSLSADEVLSLQSAIGNREVSRLLAGRSATKVQAKLTIGQPGDKYEQEADRVASQVLEQIHAPASAQSTRGQSVQRQEESEEEIQAKPSISDLQRSPLSPEVQREAMPAEDELQASSILPRGEAIAVGDASTDLESAIHSARGSGQPLDAGLQQSMGQAMGADFSGVRVHTDAQSDQLNKSIQAKAFTTGQDVFFRQGEYNLGSRGGQELIAHELTHVVQQNVVGFPRVAARPVIRERERKSENIKIQRVTEVSPEQYVQIRGFVQTGKNLIESMNASYQHIKHMLLRERVTEIEQLRTYYGNIRGGERRRATEQGINSEGLSSGVLAEILDSKAMPTILNALNTNSVRINRIADEVIQASRSFNLLIEEVNTAYHTWARNGGRGGLARGFNIDIPNPYRVNNQLLRAYFTRTRTGSAVRINGLSEYTWQESRSGTKAFHRPHKTTGQVFIWHYQ